MPWPPAALRFKVGDRVECHSDDGSWNAGVIVGLHYHEPKFGEGVTVPYQIKLDAEDRLIFVTRDSDDAIRWPSDKVGTRPATQPAAQTASPPGPGGSKISRARVGSRANTIGMRHAGSKIGGSKAGKAGKFRAVPSARPRQARNREPEPVERWRAATQGPGTLPSDEL